tara:strand:- start:11395 stop:12012 length:618 start_codon:yes stop_codon:yes gene_type:complete
VALAEKNLEYELILEKVWERRESFIAINPAGNVPVLSEPNGDVVSECMPICEYLEEVYNAPSLYGPTPLIRSEVRRLTCWFVLKFEDEVTRHIHGEKFVKRFLERGEPDSVAMRAGLSNIRTHLDYIAYLVDRRRWLAGDEFSLADIAAASQLSVIDYLGDVPWDLCKGAKEWYARVKSRPSFRGILSDYIAGFPPPKNYADLDF